MKLVVSKDAVRQYIREMLENPAPLAPMGWKKAEEDGKLPASVSDVVDPSAAVTDPGNPNFKPKNRAELQTAMASLVKDISDDDAASLYDVVKDTVSDMNDEDKKMADKKVEEAIRRVVRKMISEAGPYRDTGMSYSGPVSGGGGDVDAAEKAVALAMKSFDVLDIKRKPEEFIKLLVSKLVKAPGDRLANVKAAIDLVAETDPEAGDALDTVLSAKPNLVPKKNVTMTDVGGTSLPQIAKDIGLKSHGKLQAFIDNALEKARYLMTMDPDEKQILFLTAMNDYIKDFSAAGELTAADVQLLKDHPEMVADLDTFRVYFDKYLKRVRKSGQQVYNPVK